MKQNIVIFSLILLGAMCACQQSTHTKTSETETQDSITMDGAIAGDLIVENFVANYKGTINDQYPISLEFIKFTSTVGGSYKYDGKNTSLKLKGSMEDTGEIRMSELNSEGEETGFFEGKMVGEKITGTWYNKKRTKSMPFSLERTSIASLQTKSDILSDAMGQFSLTSITGSAGANTMFDTYRENSQWRSSSSGITSGMREEYKNELSDADIQLLNNLHVEVDEQLNVHVYAGLIELVNCPFKAGEMEYRVKETDKEKMNLKIAGIIPTNIINDTHLDLVADDHVDFSGTLKGGFDMVALNNMILSYYPAERKFELDLFYGVCCDGNILTFQK